MVPATFGESHRALARIAAGRDARPSAHDPPDTPGTPPAATTEPTTKET
jgi:hypothetical protein